MDFDITFANEISAKTPNLCHLAPAGPTYMEDLNEAGGVYAVMNELNKLGSAAHRLHDRYRKDRRREYQRLRKLKSGSHPPGRKSVQQDRRTGCPDRKSGTGRKCCKTFCRCA